MQSLAEKESQALEAASIRHAPTIGEMYEGLTSDILSRTLPPSLDLQVVSGFAEDHAGRLSNQIDCMLVKGQGIEVPYTQKFKWPIKDVVAVIEVKKTLFSKGLDEAYHQLRQVLNFYSEWIQNTKNKDVINIEPSRRAFSDITGLIAPPYDQLNELPLNAEYVFHTVLGDQYSPVRIAFGYSGFNSEHGLRQGFLNFIKNKVQVQGYGPHSYPQLIVAGGASIVKFSGHPYRAPMRNGKMLLLASSSANPLLLLLELIWTRLTYFHPMPELFGEDLQLEGFNPLLWAHLAENPKKPGHMGWQFTVENIKKRDLENTPKSTDWEPVVLTHQQYTAIVYLCENESIDTAASDFVSFASTPDQTVEQFIDSLIETRLVARNGHKIELATVECQTAILPDGRYIAAENNSGRLSRWIERHMNDVMLEKKRADVDSGD